LVVLAAHFLMLNSAVAEEAAAAQPVPRKSAVNFRAPEAYFKSYFFNIEHLISGRHGVVLEGGYIGAYPFSLTAGGKSAKWKIDHGYTLSAQYRFHFSKQLDSPFIGVFFKYGSVSGILLSSDGPDVVFASTDGQPQIGFSSSYQMIGLNIGHRIIVGPGITLTLRVGAGGLFGNNKFSTEDYAKNRDAFDAIFNTFLRFDSELSIGYAF
jgi:hypothetical protein